MQTGDKIKQLREKRGLTQTQLSELLGFKTYTTVTKWEANENFPKGKDLKRLAEFFNVTSDYLLGLTIEDMMEKVGNLIKIPVLGTITCGDPILAHENIESYIDEVEENLPSGELFYLKTQGDSMAPTIPQNSFVLIRKQEYVESGEIAAVIVNGDNEATLKRVKYQGDIVMLIPDNKAYEPIVITESNHARIIGKAVKVSINL